MSSDELQGTSAIRAKDSSEMDYNIDGLLSSSGQRSLETSIKPTEQQSNSTGGLKKIQCEPAIGLDISMSACKPLTSAMEENKLIYQRAEEIRNVADFLSKTTPSSSHSHDKPHSSNLSIPETKKDASLNPASEPTEKAVKSSSLARPAPLIESAPSPSDLPFRKEKIAESLSLEEACGFLPYIMKTKRADLRVMENQLDEILVDLQKALGDAKNICILLENAQKEVPEDVNAARVHAQKLVYLLSSSFRIFEKLDHRGRALKEGIKVYSKQTGDYHSSFDILLEHIMEQLLEKCNQTESKF